MSVVPILLFTLAAVAATCTIWSSLSSALPAILDLRAQRHKGATHHRVSMCTLDVRSTEHTARGRRRRKAHPNRVTHRLHHFAHPTKAA